MALIKTAYNKNRHYAGFYYLGGANQTRTDDPLLAKQVLYQLSYDPNRCLIL